MRRIDKLTRKDFDRAVLHTDVPVVVEFYASWCGPCRAYAPTVERLAREHPEVRVLKLNVDEAPEIASQFAVRTVPTLISFEDGRPAAVVAGRVAYPHLLSLLDLEQAAAAA